VKNWAEYDRALVNRGNLTIWFDEASIAENWTPPRPVGRGKPGLYSDVAIQTCLTLKALFRLPYRATEGLLRSLMRLCALDLPVPDHTPMSRRAATLTVKIPRRPRSGATHVVVDSTGLKIFGEGEWKVRQHGVGKRRTWRKIHLAVDESAKDIIGIEVSTADWHDNEVFPDLLAQVEGEVAQVSADGAYDSKEAHAAKSYIAYVNSAPTPLNVTNFPCNSLQAFADRLEDVHRETGRKLSAYFGYSERHLLHQLLQDSLDALAVPASPRCFGKVPPLHVSHAIVPIGVTLPGHGHTQFLVIERVGRGANNGPGGQHVVDGCELETAASVKGDTEIFRVPIGCREHPEQDLGAQKEGYIAFRGL
jgi:hypothetical protein